jgi:hypothetical protein
MSICNCLHQIIIKWLYFKNGICQVLNVIIAAGGLNRADPNSRCLNLNEKMPKKMLAKNIISETIKKNHPAFKPYFNFFCIVYLQM